MRRSIIACEITRAASAITFSGRRTVAVSLRRGVTGTVDTEEVVVGVISFCVCSGVSGCAGKCLGLEGSDTVSGVKFSSGVRLTSAVGVAIGDATAVVVAIGEGTRRKGEEIGLPPGADI